MRERAVTVGALAGRMEDIALRAKRVILANLDLEQALAEVL